MMTEHHYEHVGDLIREMITPPAGQRLLGSTNVDAARATLKRFEDRARELDGDDAPTGFDALKVRCYPSDIKKKPTAAGMKSLRITIEKLLKP
jgi:hypothetical protein